MQMRTRLLAMLSAVLLAAWGAGLTRGDRNSATTGDPRSQGLMPHPLPEPALTILQPTGGNAGRPTTPTQRPPTPTPGTGTAAQPASRPAATSSAPESLRPATGPDIRTVSKTDYSSPKKTLKSYLACLAAADLEGVKACFAVPTTEEEKELLEGLDTDNVGDMAVRNALKERFPGQPTNVIISTVATFVATMVVEIDNASENINGNKATVQLPGGAPKEGPPVLVKVGNDWKFPLVEGNNCHKRTAEEKRLAKARDEVRASVIADIKAGKYATIEEAYMDFMKKLDPFIVVLPPAGARSRPASAPAK
jgi:hypothetical protein